MDSCIAANNPLFDHLVGAAEERERDGDAERAGSLQIEDQLELGFLLHRQVGRILAFENAADINADRPEPPPSRLLKNSPPDKLARI